MINRSIIHIYDYLYIAVTIAVYMIAVTIASRYMIAVTIHCYARRS